ncbi:uncharacterized protein LOC106654807 [Trichogramma pretiosum]|uniref:uncharacterized protein LOC106654807 n=1 Tax=Trichogramma pretiosum TaxID=7493 RepID=UPI0006C9843B|nr:uncharacterized protein LOC106654807 [Trichogramma pretiosum]
MNNVNTDNYQPCPNLTSTFKTPRVYWYQNDCAIFIRIMLVDVEKYYLKVDCDSLIFRTSCNDQKYFWGINLCGTVIAEKTSHKNVGREIKICLIKAHKWNDWPRLQMNMEKNQFILRDPDHIVKKSWDNPYANAGERESFAEYKKRMNITNIGPPESSDSGSESDDEKLMGHDLNDF